MAKLRINQKNVMEMDLSKTLSRGLTPYYRAGIGAIIKQNFIPFSMGADTRITGIKLTRVHKKS